MQLLVNSYYQSDVMYDSSFSVGKSTRTSLHGFNKQLQQRQVLYSTGIPMFSMENHYSLPHSMHAGKPSALTTLLSRSKQPLVLENRRIPWQPLILINWRQLQPLFRVRHAGSSSHLRRGVKNKLANFG